METYVKLRIMRLDNNLTQADVAKMLGITRSSYCSYEIGRRKMSIKMLEKLAQYYRVPISSFFDTSSHDVNDSEHYAEEPLYISSLAKDERKIIFTYRISGDKKRDGIMQAVDKKEEEYDAEE